MKLNRRSALVFILVGIVGGVAIACSGSDGAAGPPGPQGAAGSVGQTGAQGAQGLPGVVADAGNPLAQGACTTPCHTFGGVVDQWRFSNHSHPQESEIGVGPCGNCHGIDGLQQRLDGNYAVAPDAGTPSDVPHGHVNFTTASGTVAEINYGGATAIGRIHCSTCHDFNPTTDPHVTGHYLPGQAPLRVPGGVDDYALIEKTPDASAPIVSVGQAVKYRAANTCIFCHKSRKDVTAFIGAKNTLTLRWGPHNGPQSDVYSGLGGYQFAGLAYSSSRHATLENACIDCHMSPNANNGNVPDHTMKPSLAFCKTCHTEYKGQTFDIQGGQTIVKNALFELQALLSAAGMLTRSTTAPYAELQPDELADGQFDQDLARPNSGPGGANLVTDAPTAGALYNYFLVARSSDFGVHNPTYAKQLLWDSIKQIKGSNPSSLAARPL